jgi:predicted Fe-S protein YdhL (DUF1289 family)
MGILGKMTEEEKKEIMEKHRIKSLKEKNKKEELKKNAKTPTRPSLRNKR